MMNRYRQEHASHEPKKSKNPPLQTHVHEFVGSTKLAEGTEEIHNHHFAGVTSEMIPQKDSHVHALEFTTLINQPLL